MQHLQLYFLITQRHSKERRFFFSGSATSQRQGCHEKSSAAVQFGKRTSKPCCRPGLCTGCHNLSPDWCLCTLVLLDIHLTVVSTTFRQNWQQWVGRSLVQCMWTWFNSSVKEWCLILAKFVSQSSRTVRRTMRKMIYSFSMFENACDAEEPPSHCLRAVEISGSKMSLNRNWTRLHI